MQHLANQAGKADGLSLGSLRGSFGTTTEQQTNRIVTGLADLGMAAMLYWFVILRDPPVGPTFYWVSVVMIAASIVTAAWMFWDSAPKRWEFDDYSITHFRREKEVWKVSRSSVLSMLKRGDKIVVRTQSETRRIPVAGDLEEALGIDAA